MAANLFFSGRIPPELRDRLEQHIAETGESKTQVLINALAAYLNPISKSNSTSVNNTLNNLVADKIRTLEARLTALELLFTETQPSAANDQLLTDNQLDNTLLTEKITIVSDKIVPDNTQQDNDNNKTASQNKDEEASDSQEESIKSQTEGIPRDLEIFTTIELCKKSGLTRNQLDNHKKKVVKKYEELGKSLEDKKMLDFPEKIETRNPIMINGYPYDLCYWGQNEKGNNLWTAVPYDNERYQQLALLRNIEEISE